MRVASVVYVCVHVCVACVCMRACVCVLGACVVCVCVVCVARVLECEHSKP